MTDVLQHFADADKLIADCFAVFINCDLQDIAFRHFHVAHALLLGGEDGADLRAESFAEIFKSCADRQTILRESGLCSAINELEENLSHCNVDRVTYKVGVERFQNGFAWKNFARHSCGMRHAGASQRFDKRFFNNAVFDVQRQFAGTLLRRAPANAVRQTGNIGDFIRFYPATLFRNRGRTVFRTFCESAHALNFMRIVHIAAPFVLTRLVKLHLISRALSHVSYRGNTIACEPACQEKDKPAQIHTYIIRGFFAKSKTYIEKESDFPVTVF